MTCTRVNQLGQGIDIRAKKLFQAPISENISDDGTLGFQLLQHLLARDILPCLRLLGLFHDFHLAKEDVAHLFGRRDVECLPRQFVDVTLVFQHSLGEDLRSLLECLGVYQHTVHLHVSKNGNERHLDVPEQILHVSSLQFGFQYILEPQCHIGIFSSIFVNINRGKVSHVLLCLSLGTYQLVNVDGLVVQIDLRHIVHVMSKLWLEKIVCQHRVEHLALNSHTIIF